MGQWSDLPAGLMDTIDGLLSSYADKVRLRAVCVSWNSQLPKVDIPFPRLLQAFKNKSNPTPSAAIEIKSNPTHGLFNLLDKKFEFLDYPTHGLFNLLDKKFEFLDLPELQRKLFKGSSYGWVVAFDDSRGKTSPDIFLIDILTKVKIQLPPRYTFPDVYAYNVKRKNKEYSLHSPEGPYSVYSNYVHRNLIDKVVLSSSPSSGDCVVVAIYGAYGSLAWCKCNDKSWTSLCSNFGPRGENRRPFSDILFSDGRLYALNQLELLVFDHIDGPSQKLTKIASIPPDFKTSSFEYLGESSDGERLLVLRYLDDDEHTMTFKVYKLDPINSSWLEVKNIGDDIMFLGLNPTLCISSHKYSGYKGNLIYFTDSSLPFNSKGSKEIVSDIGVFNMEDGSIELLPGFKGVPQFLWPPPIWIVL